MTETQSPGSRTLSLLRTLNAIGRLSSTSSSDRAIADFVTASVMEIVGGDGCALFLYNRDDDLLHLRSAPGFDFDSGFRFSMSTSVGIVGAAARSQTTVNAPDAPAHPDYFPVEGMGEERYRSQVAAPMISQDTSELIGVLTVFAREPDEFGDETVAFLEAIAREATHAIVASRSRTASDEQLRKKIAELSTLQRVSRVIAS
ncbi:MAG: GAF domain-containing protein, partial [Chloroflexota bacterium]|nr:GAF domain-containing protein [Chloroflexota bacterium]